MTRIACVQTDVAFGDAQANIANCIGHVQRLASEGVDLALFPECFLTGYCVASLQAATDIAIGLECLTPLVEASQEHGVTLCVGFARRDAERVYNSAAVIQPNGRTAVYDKTHLPYLGLDRFVQAGDRFLTVDAPFGKIGPLVCFDLRHPEPSRALALMGTQLMMLPTNWPVGAHAGPDCIAPARAAENRMFVATCNRVGEENGFSFIGRSGIYDVTGRPVVLAGPNEETIIADIELSDALSKRSIIRPGEYEIDVVESRRPELYGPLFD